MPFVFCFKIFVLNFMLLNPQLWRPKPPSYPKGAAQARQEQVPFQCGRGSIFMFPSEFRLWGIFSPQLLWLNYQWAQWKSNAFLRQWYSHPLGNGLQKHNLFHTCAAKELSDGNSLLWNVFVMRMNIHSRTKLNLSTSLTLKTKSPLAKSFKVAHHPLLAWDPGSNKVQELLPSRAGNEIPNRCRPGVKK